MDAAKDIHKEMLPIWATISYFSRNSYGSFEVNDFQFEGVVRFLYLESGLDNGNKIWNTLYICIYICICTFVVKSLCLMYCHGGAVG
jgi:hypothetical protein